MNRRFPMVLVLAVSLPAFGVLAQQSDPTNVSVPLDFLTHFQQGNQAYLEGDYAKAVAEYERVVDGGVVHPDLFFNLANAYHRAKRQGLAVLYFEKALDLDPADAAAESNLAAVRKELIDRVVMSGDGGIGEPLWQQFIRGISVGILTWVFFGLYFAVFGIGIARRLIQEGAVRRLLFWVNVPLLSLSLVSGLLLASRIYVQERIHRAVVVASAAPLVEGPERAAKVLMEVHEGLKVRLLSEAGDYFRVRLANGVEGFLKGSQVGRI